MTFDPWIYSKAGKEQLAYSLFGSYELLYVGCYSYIADTVPPEKRAFRITILDASMLLFGGFANVGVGYWIRSSGYFWPYLYVVSGKLLALLYAIFFIPETVQKTSTTKLMSLWVRDEDGYYI